MHAHRLAVCTTVYPGCEPFLAAWYDSVRRQTDRDFDLWVALDAIAPAALRLAQAASEVGRDLPIHWVFSCAGDTPATLRQRAFACLVHHYDEIVLVDADDVLQPTRVAAARAALATVDVAGCALRLVDERGADLGLTFAPDEGDDLSALLVHYNVFGLSNSAYRSAMLARCLPVPGECVLTDWLLAARARVRGATFAFDREPRMAYRQYARNCARVRPPFSEQAVLTASTLVAQHYRLLLGSEWAWPAGAARQPFEAARLRADTFHRAIRASAVTLTRYVSALNQLPPRYVWWWAVAHPDLEHLWAPSVSAAGSSRLASPRM